MYTFNDNFGLGASPDTYQEIMNAERAELYAPAGRYEELYEKYNTGLFSPGRPGIVANELDLILKHEVLNGSATKDSFRPAL